MAEEGKMREERTPILGREVGKPLRPEEYPSQEEIASLTGEVGASRLETVLKTMGVAAPVLIAPILTRCVPTPTETPIVRTPEEVGLEPTPTLEIKTPTAEPTPTEKITPSPTATSTEKPTVTPSLETTPTAKATSTKEPTPIPEPTPKPVEMVATGNVDLYLSPDGQKVGYFVPGQRFTPTGKEQNGWIQVVTNGNTLWIQEGGPYGPAGEVEPPSPACEVPHFTNRSIGPDAPRKTGWINSFGERSLAINPEGAPVAPYYHWFRRTHDSPWVTKRDGKIVVIDKENQIVTFDLGMGLVVRRRFTEGTQVMMYANEAHVGMSYDEVKPIGGNFCDLEEGDTVAILHPSEGEGANPSPEGDLWGVLIVQ